MMGKYVYCILPYNGERKSLGNIGFEWREVCTIGDKYFSAVVSDSPLKEFEPKEEEVRVHKRVAEELMKEHSVLPVAYGMVFKNNKILLLTMRKARKAMRKAMKAVNNKLELGIKIVLPKEDAEWDEKREGYAKQWESDFAALKRIASESKKLRLFSQRLILNSAFLVDRNKVEEFSRAVERLGGKYPSFKIQYTGPWPPYNFVDIHILGRQRGGFR